MLKNYLIIKNKLNLKFLPLILLIFLAVLLRVYKIGENYYFSGELGKEMLFIREYYLKGGLPLSGMPTSHEWLTYGPFYYWLMLPVYALISQSPFILFWSAIAVSIVGLILNYFVIKKISSEHIAFLSTLIQSLSPLFIWQTRLSKLHVFFWILVPLLVLSMYYLWHGKTKWIFWCGLIYGLMFSFHFSQLPIFLVFVLFYIFKKNIFIKSDVFKFFLGVLIPNITYIWGNLKLVLWLPYRVINPANKNPEETITSIVDYFGMNIFWDQRLWVYGLVIFLISFLIYLIKNIKFFRKDFFVFIITSFIGITLIANILHGTPPVHYFLPIFTITPVLLAVYLSKLKYWILPVLAVTLVNLISFNNDPLFYKKYVGKIPQSDIVSYSTLDGVAEHILKDSGGGDFFIKRLGPYDYFPENYSQNYKYLLLYKGGKLNDKSSNIYIIAESENEINVQK